jgi:DNA repair exonuclease SbcCD ATPase subunit
MIEFKQITLQNFMGYGNDVTTVKLNQAGTTLIVGEDLDNPSSGQSNGCGKTTIMNAFTYALYDKPIDNDIAKDDLVNNVNKKNMEVTLEFVADNGKSYKIARSRKTKAGNAGNNVYLWEDGVDKTPDSMAATNEKIESIIGIPYEVFVRIVVFSAAHSPFLNLTTKEQTAIIEELFGLTTISRKAELLKAVIKDAETSLKIKQTKIDSIKAEIERHNVQIDAARKRVSTWDTQRIQNIESLNQQIQDLSDIDIGAQQKLLTQYAEIAAEIKTQQIDLDKANVSLTNQIRLVKSKEKEKVTIAGGIKAAAENIKKQQSEQTHLQNATCPYCMQHFDSTEDKIEACTHSIAKSEEEIGKLDEDLDVISKEIVADRSQQSGFERAVADITQTITVLNQQLKLVKQQIIVASEKEIQQIEHEKLNLQKKIEDLNVAENPHKEAFDELVSTTVGSVDYTEINEISKIIDHQKFLLKLLTKKDSFVRKTLLNKNIPFLNTKLQEYLSDLGLPHKVEFTKEMSASISRFGRTLGFGNLSAGQKARVNFALSLAFKDVLQSIHTRVNVFMLDEILDHGLDSVGVQNAAKLVKRKSREEKLAMFVISHREEVGNIFDRKMVVQMHHGFSHLKEETE